MKKLFFLISILILAMPFMVFGTSGESMPWDEPLEKIQDALTGRTVMIIGIILIAGAGIMLAASDGGQAKQRIFYIVLGIGVALNAPRVLALLFGEGTGALW